MIRGFAKARRVAAFLAIVWGVAGSFIAFEIVALGGFDLLLMTRGGRALALSNAVRQSTSCSAAPKDDPASPATDGGAAGAAWSLGVISGMQAQTGTRQGHTSDDVLRLAKALGVPTPRRFVPENRVEANLEFVRHVEANEDATATAIASRYGARPCHVFKLGAYWGYAMPIRAALPGEAPPVALELEHHARAAGLDERIWRPLIIRSRADATRQELALESIQLTESVTRHLQPGEPVPAP